MVSLDPGKSPLRNQALKGGGHAYLILISWIALSLAKPAAETYLINPEGTGDFPTIQAAIDAVVDGKVLDPHRRCWQ